MCRLLSAAPCPSLIVCVYTAWCAGWTPPEPAHMKPKTCNLDDHHGPAVGAADVQGGFYVEGINGIIRNDIDLAML